MLLHRNNQLQSQLDLQQARFDSFEFQYSPIFDRMSQLFMDQPSLAGNHLVTIPLEFRNNNTWPPEYKKRFYQDKYRKWKTRGVWTVSGGMLKPSKPGLKNVSSLFDVNNLAIDPVDSACISQY
jgi:hypothetical protein